jgi:hypothetical protein
MSEYVVLCFLCCVSMFSGSFPEVLWPWRMFSVELMVLGHAGADGTMFDVVVVFRVCVKCRMNNANQFPSLPAMAEPSADPATARPVVAEGLLIDFNSPEESTNPSLADEAEGSPVGPSYAAVLVSPARAAAIINPVPDVVQEEFPLVGEGVAASKPHFPRSPRGQRKYQSVGAGQSPLNPVGEPTGHILDSPVVCPSRPISPKKFTHESRAIVTMVGEFDPLNQTVDLPEEALFVVLADEEILELSSDESVQTVKSVRVRSTNLGGEKGS